jgi:ATP-dependent helicase/DNAse subunit B
VSLVLLLKKRKKEIILTLVEIEKHKLFLSYPILLSKPRSSSVQVQLHKQLLPYSGFPFQALSSLSRFP